MEVVMHNGKLLARAQGEFIAGLKPVGGNRFVFTGANKGEAFVFLNDEHGHIEGLEAQFEDSYYRHFISQGSWIKDL